MRKNVVGRAVALLTSMLMVLGSIGSSVTVNAKSFVDPANDTGSISITLKAKNSETVVAGGTLHLVQVAGAEDVDNEGLKYVVTDEFKDYTVSESGDTLQSLLSNLDESDSSVLADDALAEGLMEYAVERSITGITQTVGADGTVTFTNVPVGLWLIYQKDDEAAEGFLAINPFLVTVPQVDETKPYGEDTGYYVFDVNASPKVEPVSESTSFTVNKVWADANNYDGIRPASITVQLYADQPVEGTSGDPVDGWYAYGAAVPLEGEGNTWSTTWNLLPKFYDGVEVNYKAVESGVPDGYTSETSEDGHTITNTHDAGVITVTKRLMQFDDTGVHALEAAVDGTFYVALFSDEACTNRVSDVQEITFRAEDGNVVSKEVTFSGLALGTYYVAETDAEGSAYASAAAFTESGTEFTVMYSNEAITLTDTEPAHSFEVQNVIPEEPYTYDGTIVVNKDVLYGEDGEDLESDYPDSEKVFYFAVYSEDGTILRVLVLDYAAGERSVTFKDLPVATNGSDVTYTVKEVDCDDSKKAVPVNESSIEFSFTPDKVSQEVMLNENKKQDEVTFTNIFVKETEPETEPETGTEEEKGEGKLTLEKVDADDGEALEGAVFAIYSDYALKDEVDEITTNENGVATSEELPEGTYYVKEIQAPDGYRLDSDNPVYTVKVKDGETVSVTSDPIENTKKTKNRSVSTGVETRGMIYGGCAVLAAAALILLVIKRRREE